MVTALFGSRIGALQGCCEAGDVSAPGPAPLYRGAAKIRSVFSCGPSAVPGMGLAARSAAKPGADPRRGGRRRPGVTAGGDRRGRAERGCRAAVLKP